MTSNRRQTAVTPSLFEGMIVMLRGAGDYARRARPLAISKAEIVVLIDSAQSTIGLSRQAQVSLDSVNH
ncbi:hypothetical protein GRI38_08650 [Altererythrobacter aurantiacus]|uniref:Uncharacterized protein n=1 Tax=Parapontixanthobacter aurantiacus TaxID=1463599 RepID=A0A844ZDY5_9SPHN|nr:hypothetical protein [Parapontixanthobacter aurantiacus]